MLSLFKFLQEKMYQKSVSVRTEDAFFSPKNFNKLIIKYQLYQNLRKFDAFGQEI